MLKKSECTQKNISLIMSDKLFNRILTFFIAAVIIVGCFSVVSPIKASGSDYIDYVTPVYNFPDLAGNKYNFGRYEPENDGFHLAIDLTRPVDTPVISLLDGKVVACGYMQGFGDRNGPGGAVIIAHKNKYGETFYALYGHLKDLQVAVGQNVSRAQPLGKIMNLVNDYGVANPHLHFGINTVSPSYAGNTSEANPNGFVDPYPYLEQNCKTFNCNITVTAGNGGMVSGFGTYENGESAVITATPDEKYVFDGWYENGTKIDGADSEYTFQVRADRNIKAKFVPKVPLKMEGISVSGSIKCGSELTFTVNTSGGIYPYKYAFYILKDGKIYYKNNSSVINNFSYKLQESGTYTLVAYCDDFTGKRVSQRQTFTVS